MEKILYKRLGDYILPTMEKNVGLKVRLSQGINNNKYFQNPRQVAQDSENDQIVRRGQFAYNKATTRNGEKISIAYREGEDCTVSSAYQVFYIKDEEQLNPHYLMMWFKRPEFDRYARFKSHGSAHEFFTFEDMCNVMLPVPSIEEQRRIVAEYQTVERRIKNNEALIQKLEETAQAIYHHTFVEGIDENNLPEGWRMGYLEEIVQKTFGGDWGKDNPEGNYTSKVLCLRGTDIPSAEHGQVGTTPMRYVLPKNLDNRSLHVGDIVIEISGGTEKQSTGRSVLITEDTVNIFHLPIICSNFCRFLTPIKGYEYLLYGALKNEYGQKTYFKYENSSNNIHNLDIECFLKNERLIIPDKKSLEIFNKEYSVLMKGINCAGKEISSLRKLKSLLTSKLA